MPDVPIRQTSMDQAFWATAWRLLEGKKDGMRLQTEKTTMERITYRGESRWLFFSHRAEAMQPCHGHGQRGSVP